MSGVTAPAVNGRGAARAPAPEPEETGRARAHTRRLPSQTYVITNSQPGEDRGALEAAAEPALGPLPGRKPAQRDAIERNGAAGCSHLASDGAKGR
jgi:hypothetical protein